MLYHLLFPLHEAFAPFNVFRYITFRSACAGVTALLLSLPARPGDDPLAARAGSRPADPRRRARRAHQAKAGTPTMGGLLIVTAIVVPTLLWADLVEPATSGWRWLATVGFGAIGFVDDYLKVRAPAQQGAARRAAKLVGPGRCSRPAIGCARSWPRAGFATALTVPFFKDLLPDLGLALRAVRRCSSWSAPPTR